MSPEGGNTAGGATLTPAAEGAAAGSSLSLPAAAPKALTRRQLAVLRFIAASIDERGYAPSLREVCEAIGISSTNGANDHIKRLRLKGYITRPRLVARGIVLTAMGRAFLDSVAATAAGAEGRT